MAATTVDAPSYAVLYRQPRLATVSVRLAVNVRAQDTHACYDPPISFRWPGRLAGYPYYLALFPEAIQRLEAVDCYSCLS